MPRAARQLSLFSDDEEPGDSPGFSVRRSSRARRLSIKVFPRGQVEVVAPRRTSDKAVRAFVAENRDWIRRSLAEFSADFPAEPFRLPDRIHLLALDRTVGVLYDAADDGNTVRYRETGDVLRLSGNTRDSDLCVATLKRWLTSTARRAFEPRLHELAAETGMSFRKLQVRGQKTCWGSHSTSGTISINFCLLFLRPSLVRYLMVHELCHSRHMNHSRTFWRLVARHEPAWRRLDRRLGDSWKQIPTWVGLY